MSDAVEPGAARRIWVVTDGRAGNEVPATSLAEALAARRRPRPTGIEIKRIVLRRIAALAPAPVWPLFAAMRDDAGGWPFSALTDGGAALAPPWPDLVIGAGRRSAPIVAELRRRSRGAVCAVQILDPKLAPRRFDLVIAPAHDQLVGENVLSLPAALGRGPDQGAARDAGAAAPEGPGDPRLAALARPLIGALIGGPSRAASLERGDIATLGEALLSLGREGCGIAVVGSRRTPDWALAALRERLGQAGAFVWAGEGDNPYRALLSDADALVVTADSVNMTSEAAATGKRVYVAPVSRLAPKLARFQAAMTEGGHVRPLARLLGPGALARERDWRPTPLDTLSAAVERVAPLLDPAP